MTLIDSHSHTAFSHDGRAKAELMIEAAVGKGLAYYAVTEHLDRDYKYCKKERFLRQLNLKKYLHAVEKFRERDFGDTFVAFGVEAGYCAEATEWYKEKLSGYDFDVVINSIHTMHGQDAYFGKLFRGRKKDDVYTEYLDLLLESLHVPYAFDVIGHIGYITRYSGYPDFTLCEDRYAERIDALLKEIIALDKCVEINTHIRHPVMKYLPEKGILRRYFELGGRRITFSSDAHTPADIGKDFDLAASVALETGFTDWTVYKKHSPETVAITFDKNQEKGV